MNFRELQERQKAWVLHNFPEQVCDVEIEDVVEVINEGTDAGKLGVEAIADALNSGDKRLTSRKHHGLLGAAEEIGELCHAFLKMEQNIRSGEVWREEAADAIADCIIFLASFCNTWDFDLQTIVEETWASVEQRDWIEFPKNGRTE